MVVPKWYLILGGLLGLAMVFLVPPFQVMDEQRHYVRAAGIAGGQVVCQEGRLGINNASLELIKYSDFERIVFDYDQKYSPGKFGSYVEPREPVTVQVRANLCASLWLAHVPGAVGIWVGNMVSNQMLGFYLGRLLNLGVCLWLTAMAIANLGFGRRIAALVGFLPTVVFLNASFSYDGLILSGLMLLFSIAVGTRMKKLSKLDGIGVLILILITGFIKYMYLPLVLVVLWMIFEQFFPKGRKVFVGVVILALAVTAWMMQGGADFSRDFHKGGEESYYLETESTLMTLRGGSFSQEEKIKILLSKPWTVAIKMFVSIGLLGDDYLRTMTGVSGWGGYSVSLISVGLLLIALQALVLSDMEKNILKPLDARLLLFGMATSVALIFLGMYILDTPVESIGITGVQGRYFLPLLLPLVFAMSRGVNSLKKNASLVSKVDISALGMGAFVWLEYLTLIVKRYYLA